MKTVKLTINGQKVYAAEGVTILEAARISGIQIPTLCYHPRLRPLGHCRLCLVEVEGLEKPVTACDNPVREGMVVTTDTASLSQARGEILKLLLSTHPAQDCLTCEKSGACELQEKAYCLGIQVPDHQEKPLLPALQEDDPLIARDEQKCILCGRCLQVCREGAGRFVYFPLGNGLSARVAPFQEGRETNLEQAGCIYCGQCVDVCPVGALTERSRMGAGREWEFKSAPGICLECALGCRLERQVMDGKLVRVVSPREGDRFGGLCQTGKFPAGEQTERLLRPLVREEDGLREADYEEALQAVFKALLKIKQRSGGSYLAVLADGRCSNEESYLFQKLARAGLGTNHVDLGSTPGWVKAAAALYREAGPAGGPTLTGLSRSKSAIFVLGSDPEQTHPVAAMAIRRASRFCGAPVVWIGYEALEATGWADLQLVPAEGALVDLLKGIAAAREGRPYKHLAERSGICPEEIVQAARWYDPHGYTLATPSFYEGAGEVTVAALLNLVRAGGQLERGRCNLWLLPPQANARGIVETGGSPLFLPGYYSVQDSQPRKMIRDIWGVPPPQGAGFYRDQVLMAVKDKKIKGLLLIGSRDYENLDLEGLDFLAVITSSLNKIVWKADVVFPALILFEKEGTFTSAAGRSGLNLPAEKPAVMEDWKIAAWLLIKLDPSSAYPDLEAVREEMRQVGVLV